MEQIISAPQVTDELKQKIVFTVQSFNHMDYRRIISSWFGQVSQGIDAELIQKMELEGFWYHKDTLNEFLERFTKAE